ncbi:MAG: DNA/RNA non-specific endonuclease [Bacteroidota bacterium]
MLKNSISVIFLILITQFSYAQHTIDIKHTYYTMQFDTMQSTELLGYYIQTTAHSTSTFKTPRTGKYSRFTVDPLLEGRVTANDKQYISWNKANPDSKRDRGHINPFSAFNFTEDAALESMYYSNTAPQASYFNEHQWQAVEQYIMKLSRGSKTTEPIDSIKVWTGVLISTTHPKKMNDVFEPDYYWKVISYTKHGEPVTESWLGVNESNNRITDPDAIKIDLAYVKELILKYYPLLQLEF